MKKLIRWSALLFTATVLTGCAGLAVINPREKTTTQICLGSRGNLTNGPAPGAVVTEAQVLQTWGKPDIIHTNRDHLAVWHYRGDRNWSFVMPAYFIGLPIPVATGHNHVDLYFADGIAQQAAGTVEVVSGLMLGIYPPTLVCSWEKEPAQDVNGFMVVGHGFIREETASPPPASTGGTNRVNTVCAQ